MLNSHWHHCDCVFCECDYICTDDRECHNRRGVCPECRDERTQRMMEEAVKRRIIKMNPDQN